MENDDAISKVITVCVAAALAAILVGSLVLPVFSTMFDGLDDIEGISALKDLETYKTLLALIPLMVIVGIVIAIVRSSAMRNR